MSFANEARGQLTDLRNILLRRRRQTNDTHERAVIDAAITKLNDTLDLIDQMALLDAAAAIVEATAALERAVTSARLRPFDDYVTALEGIFHRLASLLRDDAVGEPLERTPEVAAPPSAPTPSEAMPTAITAAALPPIGSSRDFAALRAEYDAWFQAVTVQPAQQGKVDWHVAQLLKHQSRYQAVSPQVGVPWAMIGVMHALECGFLFTGHLHNGDPLTSRTKRVPAGRPLDTPPFSWEASAVDALTLEGFNTVTDWSVPHMLYLLEKYNGFGYRNRGLPTPYLWSFSTLYQQGKFVAGGHFEPEAISKQCGAAVIRKALRDRNIASS
jgi:lysozyme family protein